MTERKLAKVVVVDAIKEHKNADALELAVIGGWQCCVKKGEFKAGDVGVYFEVDAMLPIDSPAFAFLAGRNERLVDGKPYARIKTMKLRGELSQGLLLPADSVGVDATTLLVDADMTEALGVIKYEPAQPKVLAGNAKGGFPAFIPKTDQERCVTGDTVVITEDGHKSIKEVCETQYNGNIKSFNHETGEVDWGRIDGWGIAPLANNWLKIKTKSGKEIIVTDDHRIYVAGKGYVEAKSARVGDMLIAYAAQFS